MIYKNIVQIHVVLIIFSQVRFSSISGLFSGELACFHPYRIFPVVARCPWKIFHGQASAIIFFLCFISRIFKLPRKCSRVMPVNMVSPKKLLPYRREYTELILFLILTFVESTINISWARPLAAATRSIRDPELVLFQGLYLSHLYGM